MGLLETDIGLGDIPVFKVKLKSYQLGAGDFEDGYVRIMFLDKVPPSAASILQLILLRSTQNNLRVI